MNPRRLRRQISLDVKGMVRVVAPDASVAAAAQAGGGALERIDHDVELGVCGALAVAGLAADAVVEETLVGDVTGGALGIECLLEREQFGGQGVRRAFPLGMQGAVAGAASVAADELEAIVGRRYPGALLNGADGDREERREKPGKRRYARVCELSPR